MRYDRYNLLVPGSRFKCEGTGFDPSGIIGSGLSFIGGLISNNTNKKIAREQMAQQERFFNTQMDYTQQAEQRAYDYADKAWERENAYNDPAAQRARFENAGLNPALMMQGQNAVVGSMQSVAGGNAAPGAPSPVGYEYHDPIAPAVNTYLQSKLLNSQVEKMDAEAYQVQIDNRYREVETIGRLFEARSRIELNIANAKKAGKETDKLEAELNMINEQLSFLQDTHQARVVEQGHRNFLLDQEGRKLALENFYSDIEHNLNIEIARAEKRRLEKLMLVDEQTYKKLKAETAKEWLLRDGLKPGTPQWKLKEKEINAIIDNARRVHLPFGVSFPDGYEDEIPERAKNAAKKGRLY